MARFVKVVSIKGDKKNGGTFRVLFFVILIVAAGAYLYLVNSEASLKPGDAYAFAETGVKFPLGFEDRASVYANGGKYFYLSTKDGIKCVSASGEIRWDKAYSMIEPVMKGRGDYAAVCDNKGYVFYMFGPSGALYEKKYDWPILYFAVGARGDAGIILQEADDYRIIVFDAAGFVIFEYMSAEANVMPVCMDVSDDGRLVAISYLDIGNIAVCSRIGFMYTNEEGTYYSKTYAGGVECADLFVARVCFMANNKLIYLSDGEIACVDVESRDGGGKLWQLELKNKIGAFTPVGDRGFAVLYAEALPGKNDAEPEGRLAVYNLDGAQSGTYDFDRRATYLSSAGDRIIASDGRIYAAFNSKGAYLWEYSAMSEVKDFMFVDTGGANGVVMQTNTGAVVMKRVKAPQ